MRIFLPRHIGLALLFSLCGSLAAQEPEQLTVSPKVGFPSAEEVAELLKREPLTLENWSTWRGRLLEWINDRGQGTDPAFDAARKFVHGQLDAKGELPPALAKDNLAQYLLAKAYYFDTPKDADHKAAVIKAEKALRESLKLDPKWPQAHRDLAMILLHREEADSPAEAKSGELSPLYSEASKELDEAAKLNPQTPLAAVRRVAGALAFKRQQYVHADQQLQKALEEEPALAASILNDTALAVLRNPERGYQETANELQKLGTKYPKDGSVAWVHGLALIATQDLPGATEQFDRARQLGMPPGKAVPARLVAVTASDMLRADEERRVNYPVVAMGIQVLVDRFPTDGRLTALHAVALFGSKNYPEAFVEFDRARELGVNLGNDLPADRLHGAASAALQKEDTRREAVAAVARLTQYFPGDAMLACVHAYGLVLTDDIEGAAQELARARGLGLQPTKLGELSVPAIESEALRHRVQRYFGWALFPLLAFYFVVMGLMALVGQRLSTSQAVPPAPPIPNMEAAASAPHPYSPSKLYVRVLAGGVVLFYAALILVLLTLIAISATLLFFIFNAHVVPFSLVCTLVVVAVLAWVYLSTIYTAPRRERIGIPADPSDSVRLRQVVDEVAKQLDAAPVDEIRISPGADVRIWPESRGPFGIFGGQRRVLTVGYAALRYLSVGELQALLARQFALLGRRDPPTGFVALSQQRIEQTLDDIGCEGGPGNYINPFFLFLNAYGKAFQRLAARFTRQRNFQADQEAARLYGSGALINGLMKANVDAVLFDARARKLAEELLPDAPDLSNVYAAWDELCSERGGKDTAPPADTSVKEKTYRHLAISVKDRDRMWETTVRIVGPDGQPALRERLDLLGKLPKSDQPDDTCAVGLLDNVESLEEELTEIVTKPLADRKQTAQTT